MEAVGRQKLNRTPNCRFRCGTVPPNVVLLMRPALGLGLSGTPILGVRLAEVDCIEDVDRLDPHLEPPPAAQREDLEERRVELPEAGPAQRVAAERPEGAVAPDGCAQLTGEVGIQTRRHPDRVRGADVAFLSADRAARQSNPAGFLDVAPEFVVEVMSPDDTSAALEATAAEYLAAGVVIVLVLDPRTRTAHAYRAGFRAGDSAGHRALRGAGHPARREPADPVALRGVRPSVIPPGY